MQETNKPSVDQYIIDNYREFIQSKYPDKLSYWPIISGYNAKIGYFDNNYIIFFRHSGNSSMRTTSGIGELSPGLIGFNSIDSSNINQIREKIGKHFQATP